ncbi:MAG: DUF4097 family beta strand repeat protein [Clostridia bacterium]|nr:DUF4097 family beta strand repeat protein [Clostridia bacterium]
MTAWQKTVKYLALGLAALLSVCIIVGIVKAVSYLVRGDGVLDEMQTHTIENAEEILSLDIEVSAAELTVKTGETFALESNLKYLTVQTRQNTLIIEEENNHFKISGKKTPKVALVIPKGKQFTRVEIETGAGTFEMEEIYAQQLRFSFGAGAVHIDDMTAIQTADIEGGVGEIQIKHALLHNLDFDMGVGKMTLTAILTGNSRLECGVGETNVTLIGSKEDYTVKTEKGIGDVWIDGAKAENNAVYGGGNNNVEISGGVGRISIEFKEKDV